MRKLQTEKRVMIDSLIFFLKWTAIALLMGVIAGGVGILFHYTIEFATEYREKMPWLLYLLPAGGLLIVFFYHICKKDEDRGTNFVLAAVRENKKLSILTAPLIFVSSAITHLLGGSAGREGAAIQLGGSIGAQVGRLFRLDEKDERLITMCGMSAAFAALFGTPVTAAVFSMEVISVGVMYYSAIVPCMIASLTGAKLALLAGVRPVSYTLVNVPEVSALVFLKVIVLAVLFAMLSIVFCVVMNKTSYYYVKFIKNPYIRIVAGGVLVIVLTLIVGSRDYNGAGMQIVSDAIYGTSKNSAFILKMIFTALTLGAGYKGGEIVPVFFTGATFGNVAGRMLHLSSSLSAGLGMVSLFCGVTNCPLTSVLLSIELFGAEGLWYFAASCAISYMLSGYHGLYKEQKILYSKIKPEFIDQKAL